MRKSSDWIRCVLEDMYFLGRGMPDKSKMSGQDMFCKVCKFSGAPFSMLTFYLDITQINPKSYFFIFVLKYLDIYIQIYI